MDTRLLLKGGAPARALVALLVTLAAGCRAEPAKAPAPASATPPPSAAPVSAAAPAPGGGGGNGDGTGQGGQRFRQAGVYVDGTPVAVIKFGELPPALRSAWQTQTTSEGQTLKVRRFLLADYLEALGVDLARVKAVHFYGGRTRVGVMPGDELRKRRKELLFSFTQSERGKARMHWPPQVQVSDEIDLINDLAVYVDKAPPTLNEKTWGLELGGQPVEGIPYATTEMRGGTRLYVDGRLARVIRPKALEAPAGDPPRWSLAAQIAGAGVALDKVREVDLIDDDALVGRLDHDAAAHATFDAAAESHGRLTVHPGETKAEAILVYVQATPLDPKDR
jgi:hypothetical protein